MQGLRIAKGLQRMGLVEHVDERHEISIIEKVQAAADGSTTAPLQSMSHQHEILFVFSLKAKCRLQREFDGVREEMEEW
ncbi:hypothetical protein D3C87_1879630 [compost metagenome]